MCNKFTGVGRRTGRPGFAGPTCTDKSRVQRRSVTSVTVWAPPHDEGMPMRQAACRRRMLDVQGCTRYQQNVHFSTKGSPISPHSATQFPLHRARKILENDIRAVRSTCGHPPRPSARPSLPLQLVDPLYILSRAWPLERNPPSLLLPSLLQAQARDPA